MNNQAHLGVILPIQQAGNRMCDVDVEPLVRAGMVESIWVRDLPAVAPDDPDRGQGSDPWWALGRLAATLPLDVTLGTASIILGIRHPLVLARAAVGAQVETRGRLVLGIGTGGKPGLNRALGLHTDNYAEFARQWHTLRSLLVESDPTEVTLHRPSSFTPPPMYLATSDTERWRAIDGQADGWQTFLTDDQDHFLNIHAKICAIRGGATTVDVRLDVELVPAGSLPNPVFTVPGRGRVRCTAAQLPALVAPWMAAPVRRLLLRVHGYQPTEAIYEVNHLLSGTGRASVHSRADRPPPS